MSCLASCGEDVYSGAYDKTLRLWSGSGALLKVRAFWRVRFKVRCRSTVCLMGHARGLCRACGVHAAGICAQGYPTSPPRPPPGAVLKSGKLWGPSTHTPKVHYAPIVTIHPPTRSSSSDSGSE